MTGWTTTSEGEHVYLLGHQAISAAGIERSTSRRIPGLWGVHESSGDWAGTAREDLAMVIDALCRSGAWGDPANGLRILDAALAPALGAIGPDPLFLVGSRTSAKVWAAMTVAGFWCDPASFFACLTSPSQARTRAGIDPLVFVDASECKDPDQMTWLAQETGAAAVVLCSRPVESASITFTPGVTGPLEAMTRTGEVIASRGRRLTCAVLRWLAASMEVGARLPETPGELVEGFAAFVGVRLPRT